MHAQVDIVLNSLMTRFSVEVPSHPRFPDVVNIHRHAGSMSAVAVAVAVAVEQSE